MSTQPPEPAASGESSRFEQIEPDTTEPTGAAAPAHAPATPVLEPKRARAKRQAHRTALYLYVFALVALVVFLIALGVSNTRKVEVSYVFGDATVALIWLVLAVAILGWLLGLVTAWFLRWRTRAPSKRHAAG